MTDLEQTILKLAGRPKGVEAADIEAPTPEARSVVLKRLVANGKLHRLKTGHRTVRYFAHKKDCDAAYQRVAEEMRSRKRKTRPAPKMALPTGDMIITEKTKFTVCPPFVPRLQGPDVPGLQGSGLQRGRVLREDKR